MFFFRDLNLNKYYRFERIRAGVVNKIRNVFKWMIIIILNLINPVKNL